MKIQKIKNFGKKFFASIVLAIFTMGIFIPYASAQQRWQVSSLNKTFFEIPPDDRNLEDFVFTDQIINYKNWKNPEQDTWLTQSAKITGSMLWYKHYFNPTKNEQNVELVTNQDLSSFFVVVNNHYYNPEGKFAFPILHNNGDKYMYVYWKKDENENFCLYMDLENKAQEIFKIENTCHLELYTRKPFLLFFQVERTGYEMPKNPRSHTTNWDPRGELYGNPRLKISVTTTYNATHQDKPYITFYKPENFHLDGSNSIVKHSYPFVMNYTNIDVDGQRVSLFNTLRSMQFLRQGNQRAFRPYSFFFEDDYKTKAKQLLEQKDAIDKPVSQYNICNKYYDCQITFPVDSTSWFESFVLSVAAQYYNSPAVVNDNTYIEVPDPIKADGFSPLDYENCDTLAIGCHIGNLGKTFYNTIGKFFSNIWNGFADIIKGIFTWLWEKTYGFLEPMIKPIWEEIQNIYKEIEDFFRSVFEIITNLFKPGNDPTTQSPSATQKLLCDTDIILQNKENIEQNEGIFGVVFNTLKAGFGIFGIIDPIAPVHGSQLCTYEGIKTLKLRENSFIDIILFLIFGSSLFLLFYRKS